MITAALAALPVLQQLGQGLSTTVSQDLESLFSPSQTGSAGQNVPASATSGAANSAASAGSASPITLSSIAQSLSSGVMGVLTSVQNDLGAVTGFAEGQGGVSKSQLESAVQALTGVTGQSPAAATQAADQLFGAVDTNGSGQITSSQIGAYLGQLQNRASAKYQAAGNLTDSYLNQLSGLVGGQAPPATIA